MNKPAIILHSTSLPLHFFQQNTPCSLNRTYVRCYFTVSFFGWFKLLTMIAIYSWSIQMILDIYFQMWIGNALDEDFGRLNLASLSTDLMSDNIDSNDLCSPLSASFSGNPASEFFLLKTKSFRSPFSVKCILSKDCLPIFWLSFSCYLSSFQPAFKRGDFRSCLPGHCCLRLLIHLWRRVHWQSTAWGKCLITKVYWVGFYHPKAYILVVLTWVVSCL